MDQDYESGVSGTDGYGPNDGLGHFIEPPLWPKVIGIICIAFGAFGLCCGGLGLAMPPLMGSLMSSQMNGAPLPPTLQFSVVDYAIIVTSLVLTVVLVFGGIMLVGRRPLGRLLVLVYSVPAIGLSLWNLVRSFEKQAATVQWAKDYPDNPMAQGINSGSPGQHIGELIGMGIGLVIGVGLPLFLFVWFAAVKTKPEQITGTEDGVY